VVANVIGYKRCLNWIRRGQWPDHTDVVHAAKPIINNVKILIRFLGETPSGLSPHPAHLNIISPQGLL
jgi:hypothetical protein